MSLTYTQLTAQFANVDRAGSARPFISFLDSATALLREAKESAFEMLELKSGDRVLDVGCGPGDDVCRLAELVGPSGHVCGIDASKAMIGEALKRASGGKLPLEFVAAEAELLPMRDATFDVCRADRVLLHLSEPLQGLSEMTRVVKPAGRVMVMDADRGMDALNSSDREATSTIMELLQRNVRNPWIGRQLPGLFQACGLKDIDTRAVSVVFRDLGIASALVDFAGLARQAVEENVLTKTAASRWLDDLAAQQESGSFLFVVSGFQVMGRKN